MMKISQNTARTISPIIRGMAQAGTLPKTEANAAVSILQEASKATNQAPQPEKNFRGMLTTAEVAAILGVCNKTVLRMCEDGRIKGNRITGRRGLRYSALEVERLVNAGVEL